MLFPIKKLVEDHAPLLCIPKTALVREALALMVENDYSQLPIINEHENLIGIISETSIINTYFHINTTLSLLNLTVDHCMTSPKTISQENDIFEALNLLDSVYAVVVVEDQKPIGILTDYDTTQFFRNLSEGLIIIQDIEVTLRQYIESVFRNTHSIDAALMLAFKPDKKDTTRPAKEYEELSFRDHIQLIVTEKNWEKFSSYFAPKEMFIKLMQQVGEIRNQLAHFRGKLEPIHLNALKTAKDWLSSRPKPTLHISIVEKAVILSDEMTISASGEIKDSQFKRWLINQREEGQMLVRLGFNQIEELINEKLPNSAREHRSWWVNDMATHPHSATWIGAGWLVDDIDFRAEEVVFKQTNLALYQEFFFDLLTRLKSTRPGVTQTKKAPLQNWLSFSSGIPGFSFAWVLPKQLIFRVELYIDKGDKVANKAAFEALKQQKIEIEDEIGEKLTWTPMVEARASRVYASMPFKITRSPKEHEKAKRWGVEMMLKFIDTFQPKLRGI
jgi:CBS domain-containing protein